jgi:hypothetical protein
MKNIFFNMFLPITGSYSKRLINRKIELESEAFKLFSQMLGIPVCKLYICLFILKLKLFLTK